MAMLKAEDRVQQEIVMWFTNNFCLFKHEPNRALIYAVPNGGRRDAREAKTLKNTGLLKGCSDLVLDFGHDHKSIYVEVKTTGGRHDDEQKVFEDRVNKMGREYWLVWSLEEFKNKIEKYLSQNL